MKNVNWVNYGDVNPIPHGGFWIKQTGETTYDYVELTLVNNGMTTPRMEYWIISGTVDLSDDWLEWPSVFETFDIDEDTNNEFKVNSVVGYYGYSDFGNVDYTFLLDEKDQIKEALKGYEITL